MRAIKRCKRYPHNIVDTKVSQFRLRIETKELNERCIRATVPSFIQSNEHSPSVLQHDRPTREFTEGYELDDVYPCSVRTKAVSGGQNRRW